jgi:AcrR family transcriptional regulator
VAATEILTAEQILDAAEQALRRYGPEKATVVDVARSLGVSHGSVYRHFPSKAALRDAVTQRWLDEVSTPLGGIAAESGSAQKRLRRWFDTLMATKRARHEEDPELFATYLAIASDPAAGVRRHVEHLVAQLEAIIADGVDRGEFAVSDPAAAALGVFDATARFHNPAHAAEWSDPETDAAFERVWRLLLAGLKTN